jgi:hypothetical protein
MVTRRATGVPVTGSDRESMTFITTVTSSSKIIHNMPVGNPAKKHKVDTAPRQSSRSRQPSTRALQYLYEEAESDDEMDFLGSVNSDAGLDIDD